MPTQATPAITGPLRQFQQSLQSSDIVASLADGLIGKDAVIEGPFGLKPLVYADYVASGRALMQVERFVLEHVLPYYANSHTEASFCGGFITRLRREARAVVGRCCGAGDEHAVIFSGSGATMGINLWCTCSACRRRSRRAARCASSSAPTNIIRTSCPGVNAAPTSSCWRKARKAART